MDSMKLNILGTKSPNSIGNHNLPGYLITKGNYKILLDCGSGCNNYFGLASDLDNLFICISHLHWDHFNDVPILQYAAFTNHNLGLLSKEIDIAMPATPEDKYNILTTEKDSFSTFHTIDENSCFFFGKLRITFKKMDHAIETYAIKVTDMDTEQIIIYTGDTSFSSKDKLVKFAENADILLSESSLLVEHGFPEICSHLTAKQAGIIAREANVKKLILTHFWPTESVEKYKNEAKKEFENVFIANEGDVY